MIPTQLYLLDPDKPQEDGEFMMNCEFADVPAIGSIMMITVPPGSPKLHLTVGFRWNVSPNSVAWLLVGVSDHMPRKGPPPLVHADASALVNSKGAPFKKH